MVYDREAANIVAVQCIVLSVTSIAYALTLMCFKCKDLRKHDQFHTLVWIIILYSLLKLLYCICLFKNVSRAWWHAEQIIVGINNFIILTILWRTYSLYMLAVFNLEKLVLYFKVERTEVDIRKVNPYTYKLDKRKKTDYRASMIANIVFCVFSILVSISYIGDVLPQAWYQITRDGITMIVCFLIFGMGWSGLNQAIKKLQYLADEFEIEFNVSVRRQHLGIMIFELSCVFIWAICMFVASVYQETGREKMGIEIQLWGFFVV